MSGGKKAEIMEQISRLLRERLGWKGPVGPHTHLVEDLGLDSLKLMELAVSVENHFRIRIDEPSERGIETVGDLVSVIERETPGALEEPS